MDWLLLLATVLWGLWGVASKRAVELVHPYTVQWINALPYALLIPAWYWLGRKVSPSSDLSASAVAWVLLASAASLLGTLLFTFALRHRPASVAVAATSAYPVVTLLIGLVTRTEKITWPQVAGILLIVVGVLLVQSPAAN